MNTGRTLFVAAALAAMLSAGDALAESKSRNGMVFGFETGGAAPTGDFSDGVSFGVEAGGWSGYRIMLGDLGLIPRIDVHYLHFFDKTTGFVTSSAWSIPVLFGGKVEYHLGDFAPFVKFGVGFAYTNFGGDDEDSANGVGFAFAVGSGVDYWVADSVALGLFCEFGQSGTLNSPFDSLSTGINSFNFGLGLTVAP
ncbi:MAG TPA: outer membrane beta-barrel protein [Anaeromyxobacteraceae bacterium]|nr:outer membrane beta-barrel protein [Anaeromyxobacteraceae bacterium]